MCKPSPGASPPELEDVVLTESLLDEVLSLAAGFTPHTAESLCDRKVRSEAF